MAAAELPCARTSPLRLSKPKMLRKVDSLAIDGSAGSCPGQLPAPHPSPGLTSASPTSPIPASPPSAIAREPNASLSQNNVSDEHCASLGHRRPLRHLQGTHILIAQEKQTVSSPSTCPRTWRPVLRKPHAVRDPSLLTLVPSALVKLLFCVHLGRSCGKWDN